jgi:hypothetical protein
MYPDFAGSSGTGPDRSRLSESVYGSEGWEFESLRARIVAGQRVAAVELQDHRHTIPTLYDAVSSITASSFATLGLAAARPK